MDAAARFMTHCDELNHCSEEPDKLTRRYGSAALRQAQTLVAQWMQEAGLEIRRDAAGNLIGRRPSGLPNAKTLLLGSHLDSVRDGGKYDGPLGVLTALAALESLRDVALPFDIDLYAFADEEGLRFHTTYLGSRALTGDLDAKTMAVRDAAEISVTDAMRAFGGDPDHLATAERDPASLIGYIEAHIEQGPVLERARFAGRGRDGHHRSNQIDDHLHRNRGPRRDRADGDAPRRPARRRRIRAGGRDAGPGNAGAGRDRRQTGGRTGRGERHPRPGQPQSRSPPRDDAVWRAKDAELRAVAEEIALRRGLSVAIHTVMETPAVACDPALTAVLETAIASVANNRSVSSAAPATTLSRYPNASRSRCSSCAAKTASATTPPNPSPPPTSPSRSTF